MHRRTVVASLAFAALSAVAGVAYAEDAPLRIGTMSGPDAQIWTEVSKVASREGLKIKVIEFNDYIQPNAALDARHHQIEGRRG